MLSKNLSQCVSCSKQGNPLDVAIERVALILCHVAALESTEHKEIWRSASSLPCGSFVISLSSESYCSLIRVVTIEKHAETWQITKWELVLRYTYFVVAMY